MSPDSPAPERPAGPRDPFEGGPRRLSEPSGSCSRIAAIGCAAAAILIGLGVVVVMLEARNLVVWSLKSVRAEVEETLPEDLPPADRQRLDRAFAGALRRLREGELEPQAFQRLQSALLEFARSADAPRRDDVRALIEALERFADGTPSEDRPEAPEPAERAVPPPAET